jgi:FkbM family methyltransferase
MTGSPNPATLTSRIRRFLARPTREKYWAIQRRLVARWSGNPNAFRLPFGSYWLPEGSFLDDSLSWNAFEPVEALFVEHMLQPGMTMIDIGAHHGFYTLLASKRVGRKGRVLAFEPSPRERERLRKHLQINHCGNVSVYPYALGSGDGQGELFLVKGPEDYCNSLRPPVVNSPLEKINVRVVALDKFLDEKGVRHVDFLKIDTEGAERDVLSGARNLLRRTPRPIVLCEVADIRTTPWGYPAYQILEFMRDLDYGWFSIVQNGTLTPLTPEHDLHDTNLVAVPTERTSQVLCSLTSRI